MINYDDYEFIYTPSIKTTDAELKGYKNLHSDVKDSILPLMELTKSRISAKSNPIGSVYRRAESLIDLMEGRPFILDLTTHEDLQTNEIDSLLQEDNAYGNWRDFLEHINIPNVIPVTHATFEGDERQLREEARLLQASYGTIAIRIEVNLDDVNDFVAPIFDSLGSADNCIVIIDTSFIGQFQAPAVASSIADVIRAINALGTPKSIVPIGSSFPRMVAQPGFGEDEDGEFRMEEWLVYEHLQRAGFNSLTYGDYATIHPVRYITRGGNWVPRIDAPLTDKFIYHRRRRDIGGYILAAKKMLSDPDYRSCGSWGDNEITLAAGGSPSGKNPSHWIAVRENIHITRRVQLLS